MTSVLEPQTDETLVRYSRDRERYGLAEMKRVLGDAVAIELERHYLGIAELEELKTMALVQANRICVALGKPEVIVWPKGWFDLPQGDCDSCGQKGWCKTISTGVTFPMDCDACHRCRGLDDADIVEFQLTTPLELVLNLPVYSADDFWYVETKSNEDAIRVAQSHRQFDVYDLKLNRVLTSLEAVRLLANEEREQKFAVMLPDDLSLFLNHFTQGLFPELVTS